MTLRRGDSGTDVEALQIRLILLGHLSGSADGKYGPKTEDAVKKFQRSASLKDDGIAGPKTFEKLNATADSAIHGSAKNMDWWESDIQKIFSIGTIATITDVDTGISWQEKRFAGKNHADIQPCTKEDTAKLKKVYGHWKWARRAVFVTIDGVNYAASINGMPHGGSNLYNNFLGHHCCHFLNSRTHTSDKIDKNHQKMVAKAAKAVL